MCGTTLTQGPTFQQDSNPQHKAKAMQERLKSNKWASQSPDLNPSENLQHRLKTAVNKQPPTNPENLQQNLHGRMGENHSQEVCGNW